MSVSSLPPRKSLPPFESLRAFDAVARLGGVRKAAQGLCRNHAVISRHIRVIEDWIGMTLVERTPAGAVLTEDGLRYHKQVAAAIDMIASATIALMKRNDDHLLYAWCMPGFALHWLMAHLAEFEHANPNIAIELRPTDTMPDFDRHEADVDIRLSPNYGKPLQLSASVRTVEVARPPVILVASPEYVGRSARILKPEDLLSHDLIHEDDFDSWRAWLTMHGVSVSIELTGVRLWNANLTMDAARRGRGVALANQFVAAEDLAAGHLVEVGADLPEFERLPIFSYLFVARADRWNAPPVQRFREWLLRTVAQQSPKLPETETAR